MKENKTTQLKKILQRPSLSFLMEAHNGISAKIVEESGFEGIWGSGLCISAMLGVRDNNEATWTQIAELAEFMSDITTIPILLDGDTGYGDFNILRRVCRKLGQRGIAGICIEDKLFPKKNSFIDGDKQALADIDEFCGKIKAVKDSQLDPDFCVVARVEAFIAGWGLGEALKRAEAYHLAGADAILVHSKKTRPDEIIEFMNEWKDTCSVVIVPTKYYSTPVKVFEKIGISTVIWANHLLRSSVMAMKTTAKEIYENQSLTEIEDKVETIGEIFRLQGADELNEAEKRYLPKIEEGFKAIILAASRGHELGKLTSEYPKAMLPIRDVPLLYRVTGTLNELGIKNITVVRGYKKEMVNASNIKFIDNDLFDETKELYSLSLASEDIKGNTLISYGDILFKKYVPMNLLDDEGDISIAVDAGWQDSINRDRYADFVICDKPYTKEFFEQKVLLKEMGNSLDKAEITGEWIGLIKLTRKGSTIVYNTMKKLAQKENFKSLRMSDLFNEMVKNQHDIHVVYIHGNWIDIDDLYDFTKANSF